MVKHTQNIRRQNVFDHFMGLALKALIKNDSGKNLPLYFKYFIALFKYKAHHYI